MQIINWYPGHIAKAQRQLKENAKLVDLIIEMIDARLPVSSHFQIVDQLLPDKDRLIVLNKTDLAENAKLPSSVNYWQEKGFETIALSLQSKKDIKNLKNALSKFHQPLKEKLKKRGLLTRP